MEKILSFDDGEECICFNIEDFFKAHIKRDGVWNNKKNEMEYDEFKYDVTIRFVKDKCYESIRLSCPTKNIAKDVIKQINKAMINRLIGMFTVDGEYKLYI
jgi:hypothetical protein